MDKKEKKPRGLNVTVDVTAEIIKSAVIADSSHCMIAEAIRKSVPGVQKIAVDVQTIRFSDPKKPLRYVYLTPRIAQVPLIQFDQGTLPEPFKFALRRAHVIYRKPSEREIKKNSGKNTTKARKTREALANAGLVPRDHAIPTLLDRVGGKAPPVTSFSNRRAFGLRALGRPSLPEPEKE